MSRTKASKEPTKLLQISDWLRTGEACRLLGISDVLLRRWARAGKIRAVATPHGLLFDPADVQRLAAEREAKKAGGPTLFEDDLAKKTDGAA